MGAGGWCQLGHFYRESRAAVAGGHRSFKPRGAGHMAPSILTHVTPRTGEGGVRLGPTSGSMPHLWVGPNDYLVEKCHQYGRRVHLLTDHTRYLCVTSAVAVENKMDVLIFISRSIYSLHFGQFIFSWSWPWALDSLILLHNIDRVKLDYEHKHCIPTSSKTATRHFVTIECVELLELELLKKTSFYIMQ